MKIPCDTIARLSHLLPAPEAEIEESFRCFRLDNGKVIVSNRRFMAIERVGDFDGVFYIKGDTALIEQCRTEAQWSSVIEFTAVPSLKYTTAITSMGFKIAENIGYWPGMPGDFDKWPAIVGQCIDPLTESKGPMVFDSHQLFALAQAAPSGAVSLEQCADPDNRPTVVRDIESADWVGFFLARISDWRQHVGASVPGWCK